MPVSHETHFSNHRATLASFLAPQHHDGDWKLSRPSAVLAMLAWHLQQAAPTADSHLHDGPQLRGRVQCGPCVIAVHLALQLRQLCLPAILWAGWTISLPCCTHIQSQLWAQITIGVIWPWLSEESLTGAHVASSQGACCRGSSLHTAGARSRCSYLVVKLRLSSSSRVAFQVHFSVVGQKSRSPTTAPRGAPLSVPRGHSSNTHSLYARHSCIANPHFQSSASVVQGSSV